MTLIKTEMNTKRKTSSIPFRGVQVGGNVVQMGGIDGGCLTVQLMALQVFGP